MENSWIYVLKDRCILYSQLLGNTLRYTQHSENVKSDIVNCEGKASVQYMYPDIKDKSFFMLLRVSVTDSSHDGALPLVFVSTVLTNNEAWEI